MSQFFPLLFLFLLPHTHATLVQIQIVSRHGVRSVLYKNPYTFEEGGAQLTGLGIKAAYEVGQGLRERYILNSDTAVNALNSSFSGLDCYLLSTVFDRTVSTTVSVMSGMFPAGSGKRVETNSSEYALPNLIAVFPVLSHQDQNAIILRAFDKCPQYTLDIISVQDTAEWKQKLVEWTPILQFLAPTQTPAAALFGFFNIFDNLNTDRIFNGTLSGTKPFLLNASMWEQVVTIANYVEWRRYGSAVAGNRIGGLLLHELYERMKSWVNFTSSDADLHPRQKLVFYGTHYGTLMGIGSALRMDVIYDIFRQIPGYASELIWELHNNASSSTPWYVRVLYHDVEKGILFKPIQLPIWQNASYYTLCDEFCPWPTYLNLMSMAAIWDYGTYCHACNNHDSQPCLAVDIHQEQIVISDLNSTLISTQNALNKYVIDNGYSKNSREWPSGAIAAIVVLALSTFFFGLSSLWLWSVSQKHTQHTPRFHSGPQDANTEME